MLGEDNAKKYGDSQEAPGFYGLATDEELKGLHHPKHAQAIYDQCKKLGVGVTADIPGLDIKPTADGPTKERDFLLKYLLPTSIKN